MNGIYTSWKAIEFASLKIHKTTSLDKKYTLAQLPQHSVCVNPSASPFLTMRIAFTDVSSFSFNLRREDTHGCIWVLAMFWRSKLDTARHTDATQFHTYTLFIDAVQSFLCLACAQFIGIIAINCCRCLVGQPRPRQRCPQTMMPSGQNLLTGWMSIR